MSHHRRRRVLLLPHPDGLGHVVRLVALASILRSTGDEVVFGLARHRLQRVVASVADRVVWAVPCAFSRPRRGIRHLRPESIRASFDSLVTLIGSTRPDLVIADWHFTAAAACHRAGIPLVQVRNTFWQALYRNVRTATVGRNSEYAYWIRNWCSAVAAAIPTGPMPPLRGDAELIADIPTLFDTKGLSSPRTSRWIGALTPTSAVPRALRRRSICLSFGGHEHDETAVRLAIVAQRLDLTLTVNRPMRPPRSLQDLGNSPIAMSSAVITHGGSGSCYQALRLRKPVIVVPRTIEHEDYGERLAASGAGICLSPAPTCAVLSEAIMATLSDGHYRRSATRLSRTLERLAATARDAYLDITRSLSLG